MDALVAGGGIAGTVTAIALQKAGLTATVHEAYDRESDGVGAFLTLGSNGLDALAVLGLDRVVARLGFATPTMVMRDPRARRIATMPLGTPRDDGLEVRTLPRSDLYTALRDEAVRRGIEIIYGSGLADAAPGSGGGVRARFTDGTETTADLLVSADGLHSRTRTIIDPQAPPARYTGLLNTGGVARGVSVDGRVGEANFCFGRRCFLGWFLAPDGAVWWFANPPSGAELDREALASISPEQWRARLRELFDGDDLPAAELLDATEHVMAGWNTYDFPRAPTWHRDGMVLVGDAAHAMSPSAGQGASMALEDAVVLARCLRDAPTVGPAFTTYEQQRRARVEAVVVQGKRTGDQKRPGPVGRLVRDHLIMPTVARLARRPGGLDGWITGHHLDWDTRVGV